MWPLLENIFEYISFKHTWEDGTHRTEFKCENCYNIYDRLLDNNSQQFTGNTFSQGFYEPIHIKKVVSMKVIKNSYFLIIKCFYFIKKCCSQNDSGFLIVLPSIYPPPPFLPPSLPPDYSFFLQSKVITHPNLSAIANNCLIFRQ